MRFASIALLATAVAADSHEKVEWLDSADTTINFASDNAGETASMTYKTHMNGDAMTVSGSTTISSKERDLNNFRYLLGLKLETDT